jgi:signal transduction histidine kinase
VIGRDFINNHIKSSLAKRLLINILLISFIITLFTSSIVLYTDYLEQLKSQSNNLEQLKKGYVPTLGHGLWHYNVEAIDLQLNSILSFPHVIYAGVQAQDQQQEVGSRVSSKLTRQYEYSLSYQDFESSQPFHVGELIIVIDQQYIYSSLMNKGALILATQFVKTFIVSFFILVLVNNLITKHLLKMAYWANGLNLRTPLILERKETSKDELSKVTKAINTLRIDQLEASTKIEKIQAELIVSNSELEKSNKELAFANKKLAQSNLDLEDRVAKRTQNLVEAMDKLKTTQSKLIETEKMLSLGQLVAGVAHELNTPLGVCITAQSHLNGLIEGVNKEVRDGSMTRTSFEKQIKSIAEAITLLDSNLSKSKSLVSSFKQLAVNTKGQIASRFDLTSLIKQIEDELSYSLNEHSVQVIFLYAQEIVIESYVDPLKTVIEQLIRNSLEHGFCQSSGNIYISAIEGDKKLYIDYRDEGGGIPNEIRESIFEPFVTTGRIKGQAGIGLHLVYNIVTQILDGKITLLDSNMGTHFSIEISTAPTTQNSVIEE